jgi:hypothetical protein
LQMIKRANLFLFITVDLIIVSGGQVTVYLSY